MHSIFEKVQLSVTQNNKRHVVLFIMIKTSICIWLTWLN